MSTSTAKFLVLFLLLFAGTASAYDYLNVQDPRKWGSSRGTIEEATISIRPMGLYMEYGLYLSFSAKGSQSFQPTDSLEVVFYFDFPKEAIVTDSWLWVGQDIVKASILDRWTASSIYENIVKRRKDPSILFKRSQTSYELRIFPMLANSSRKIKLTYLVPAQWTPNAVTAPLPMNLLRTSLYTPKLNILYYPQKGWTNPRLPELPNIPFKAAGNSGDSTLNSFMKAEVPADAIQASLNIMLDSPMCNGVYINRYDKGGEGLYQLAFIPSQVLGIQTARKAAILIDYDITKSSNTISQVIGNIKAMLKTNLTPADSFNIIVYSPSLVRRLSDKWIAADTLEIEKYFADLSHLQLSGNSSLSELMSNGISFVKANGNNASILLVTDSDKYGNYQTANKLIDELTKSMNPLIPVNVVDFADRSNSYNYIGGRYYYGNEYFSDNISRLTGGVYKKIRDGLTVPDMLTFVVQTLSGYISSFDVYTTLQSGYCFGRYNITPLDQAVYLNKPFLQVGRYKGTFPFVIQTSGIYKSQVISSTTSVQEVTTSTTDSLIETAWAGSSIKSLETMAQDNTVINQILALSLKYRIMSLYTSFLALEPSDTIKACNTCKDESSTKGGGSTGLHDTEATEKDTLQLQAFPNPFNSQTVIKIRLPLNFDETNASFKIYNVLGQAVRTFEVGSLGNSRSLRLDWNGRNDNGENVTSGIYFFIVTSPNSRHSVKLLMLK